MFIHDGKFATVEQYISEMCRKPAIIWYLLDFMDHL